MTPIGRTVLAGYPRRTVPSTAAGSFRVFIPASMSINTIINALITRPTHRMVFQAGAVCVPDGMSLYFKYLCYEI